MSLSQISFSFLLGFIIAFLLPGFPCRSNPTQATAEVQPEQTADYTIAFASLAPWDLDVFIANADGSEAKPLASHPDLDYNASFSPDGQWIIFTSHRDGNADLYRIRPDGSDLQRLTDHPAFKEILGIPGFLRYLIMRSPQLPGS